MSRKDESEFKRRSALFPLILIDASLQVLSPFLGVSLLEHGRKSETASGRCQVEETNQGQVAGWRIIPLQWGNLITMKVFLQRVNLNLE